MWRFFASEYVLRNLLLFYIYELNVAASTGRELKLGDQNMIYIV